MNKVNSLIDFLKQIPYTERKSISSCPHMYIEYDNALQRDVLFVIPEEGTNFFTIDVELEHFEGGDRDEEGKVEIERDEITSVSEVYYWTEDSDMIEIEAATTLQLADIYNELPEND